MQTFKESDHSHIQDIMNLFEDDVQFAAYFGASTSHAANCCWCLPEQAMPHGGDAVNQSAHLLALGDSFEPKSDDKEISLWSFTDEEWSNGPDDALTVTINDWIRLDELASCPSQFSLDETSTFFQEPEPSCLTGFIRITAVSKNIQKRHYSQVEDNDEVAPPHFKKLKSQSLSLGRESQSSSRESSISLWSSSTSSTSPWSTRQSSSSQSTSSQSSSSQSVFLSSEEALTEQDETDDNINHSSAWLRLREQGLIHSPSDFSEDEEVQSILNPYLQEYSQDTLTIECVSKRHYQHVEVDDDELSPPSAKRHKRSQSC